MSRAAQRDLPWYTTPRVGWRIWRVQAKSELRSLNNVLWLPGVTERATCHHGLAFATGNQWERNMNDHTEFPPPNRYCSCGVYSYSSLQTLLTWEQTSLMTSSNFCLGTVDLWGRVIVHRYGYRAEFAKMRGLIAFHSTESTAKLIEQAYEVECVHGGHLQTFLERNLGIPPGQPWQEAFQNIGDL